MTGFMERVRWRVTLGSRSDNRTPASWTDAGTWIWGGYGYGYPGSSIDPIYAGITPAGVELTWNTSPDQAPGGSQFAGVVVGNLPVGVPVEVTALVSVAAGSSRVRATVGWNTSGAWSQTSDEPESLSVTFTPHEVRDWIIGIESEAAPRGRVTVLDLTVKLAGLDITGAVAEGATITYGRPAWLDDLEPGSLSMIVYPELLPAGKQLELEQTVTVAALVDYTAGDPAPGGTALPYAELRRFSGRVTGLTYRPGSYAVTCASNLERLTRRTLGGTSSLPVENEVGRIGSLMLDTGLPFAVIGAPRFTLDERPADPVQGLELLNQTALESGVFLTESRTGALIAYTSAHLDVVGGQLELDPELVPIEPYAAALDSGSITNRVTVAYGADNSAGGVSLTPGSVTFPTLSGQAAQASTGQATWANPTPVTITGGTYSLSGGNYSAPSLSSSGGGGGRPSVTLELSSSITDYGLHELRVDTSLLDQTSAEALAQRFLSVYGLPRWELFSLELEAAGADSSNASVRSALELEAGQAVALAGRPAYSPIAPNFRAAVLGWTERLATTSWSVTYNLGRWTDAAMGSLTWGELPAGPLWQAQAVSWRLATSLSKLTY